MFICECIYIYIYIYNKLNIQLKKQDGMGVESVSAAERSLMLTLLKSLVIPLLEYCCQL